MSLKFSILLPTKNRLALLANAIETVRRQTYPEWEIVVSDNASEENIAGYVSSLSEPRIKYVRADRPLPVTDNWNLALEHSVGDYVIMLGDDDGLLKDHLSVAAELAETFRRPELILTDALLFAYPGVMPGRTSGFLQIAYGIFFKGRREPYLVGRDTAERAVRDALNMHAAYQFNMQYSVISRTLIDKAAAYGPYFQSPYPDFYASNVNLLLAGSILAVPKPMVCIGITPKSFGYYYYNRRPEEGALFLDNMGDSPAWRRVRKHLLPGNDLFSSWLAAVETVRVNLPEKRACGKPLRVGYARYRILQLWFAASLGSPADLVRVCSGAKWWEVLGFAPIAFVFFLARLRGTRRIFGGLRRKLDSWISPFPSEDTHVKDIPARNMLEVYESVPPEYYA